MARLEVGKLEEELAGLKKRIAEYESILASREKQHSIIKSELLQIKKEQFSPRMTVVLDGSIEEDYSAPQEEDAVQYRDGILALNKDGLMRFMSQKSFVTAQKDFSSFSDEMLPVQYLSVNNKGTLLAVTDIGNAVRLDVTGMPEKRFREKAFKLLAVHQEAQPNEKVVKLLFFESVAAGELLIFTEKGMVKRVDLSEFTAANKTYFKAINLSDGDKVVSAETVEEDKSVMEVTEGGLVLRYDTSEIPLQKRDSAGVKGIRLNDGDSVVFGGQSDDEGEVIVVTDSGYLKRVILAIIDATSRANKGVKLVELDKSKVKYIGIVKMPYELAVNEGGSTHIINTEDIRIDGRPTKGKQMFKNTKIAAVAPINKAD